MAVGARASSALRHEATNPAPALPGRRL